jgi:hypothetical protein
MERRKGLQQEVLAFIKENPGCDPLNIWRAFHPSKSIGSAINRLQKKGMVCTDKFTQPHRFYHPSFFQEKPIVDGRGFLTFMSQFAHHPMTANYTEKTKDVIVTARVKK